MGGVLLDSHRPRAPTLVDKYFRVSYDEYHTIEADAGLTVVKVWAALQRMTKLLETRDMLRMTKGHHPLKRGPSPMSHVNTR